MFESGTEAPNGASASRGAAVAAGACASDSQDWLMGVWLSGLAQEAAAGLRPAPEPPTAQDLLARAVAQPAGPGLLGALVEVDLTALGADDAITFLQQVKRLSAFVAGFETRARAQVTDIVVAEVSAGLAADAQAARARNQERVDAGLPSVASCPTYVSPEQISYAELAVALREAPRTGESRILESQELIGPWRPLLDAMLAGDLTSDYAKAVGRELRNIPGYGEGEPGVAAAYAKNCADVLAVVVPYAKAHTPGDAATKARNLVTALDPAGSRKRRRKAAERDHGVYLNPVEPGTSEIRAIMPTAHAEAIHQAIRILAKDARFETADGCVTAGQRQVAALVALTLGDPGSVARVDGPVHEAKLAVHVNVLVPIETIIGASEQGGRIGNAPVTADVIRDLLAQAAEGSSTIRRLITDASGCILDAGRKHYLASDLQKFVIRLRDGYCRFPGCNAPAWRGEIDHATAYGAGGCTDLENLGVLCKHHHQMKTHAGWLIISSSRDGSCTWRSPLGRVYEHTPTDLVPPRPFVDVSTSDPPPF